MKQKFYCEECKEDVTVNEDGDCSECGLFLDIDEDVLVSGVDPNEDDLDVDEEGDGYGDDYNYDNMVQEYE